jgi:hypothetical protein
MLWQKVARSEPGIRDPSRANAVLTKARPLVTIASGGIVLEYTDAPATESTERPFATPTPTTGLLETAEGQASDMVAVMLSIVPGLGHIYKGYRLIGLLLIFFGTPMALALALLIATGTAGFGFFLLPIYWIAVMVHVWAIPDRVVTTPEDEGEQY